MSILYINNYRGFQSTYLPLKDINFFVGENSTGKSSVLKLLAILSSPGFWYYQKFHSPDIGLGNFAEIISIGSLTDFFEIGIYNEEDCNSGTDLVQNNVAVKLIFIENDNSPQLKELRYRNNTVNVQASIEGNFLKFRYSIISNKPAERLNPFDDFKNWVERHGLENKRLHREKIEFAGIDSILFHLQLFIQNLEKYSQPNGIEINISKPNFLTPLAYTDAIRAEPKRTYDDFSLAFNSKGKHTPYVLSEILYKNGDVERILKKFGSDSGLFEDVKINLLSTTEGKGKSVEILIKIGGELVNLINVGFGVSQILPILVEVIARPIKTYFAIQQTEVHLHPKAQSALGDFLFKSHVMDSQRFIIETHSDYTIDRFRLRINRSFKEDASGQTKNISQVVFFRRIGISNVLDIIDISHDGSYSEQQPKEFRDFFIKEQLDLLTI